MNYNDVCISLNQYAYSGKYAYFYNVLLFIFDFCPSFFSSTIFLEYALHFVADFGLINKSRNES